MTSSLLRRFALSVLAVSILLATQAWARPAAPQHEFTESEVDVDVVGDVDGTYPAPRKVALDTIWIADWSFDSAAPCDDTGWQHVDNRILGDGRLFWNVRASFDGSGGIVGDAAVLGYEAEPCCEAPAGYANDWYQAIRIEYTGTGDFSFDYVVDAESDFDFLRVETDSACASFARVDYTMDPGSHAAGFRDSLFAATGPENSGSASGPLSDYGPGTHCLYIAFFSDGAFSPCDGLEETRIGAAVVVDNIVVTDASGTRSEDFSDGLLDLGTFVDIQDAIPFGEWARLYKHITDNDACTENTTCAWLWTDDKTPTLANDPSMAFAPGGFVVRNWLDDIIVSPWVSLAPTPEAIRTIIQFRRFPGNNFSTGRIVQNWSIRGKTDVDDGMGGTVECVSDWGHSFQWNSLSFFAWITPTASGNPRNSGYDASADFDPDSKAIQIRHRTSDWQWIVGAEPPDVFMPGPGPFIDRTRIGRVIPSGPEIDEGIDARKQAQDTFSTEIDPTITPGTGEHFRATTDRFGTCAFSAGTDHGRGNSTINLVTQDSISVEVKDTRGAGGVVSIEVYGAIVAGPHAGKAPPPWSVGPHGFFVVPADSVRSTNGTVVQDHFFVDVDDFYFRGGDALQYFWLATDALGGVTSNPIGLTRVPDSVEEAERATRGLFEVNSLPKIDWDPGYLARVAADPHGKLDPTGAELAGSSQANCILYVNRLNSRRLSGDLNRTSFMYTLDRLGYRNGYDVYDHTGMGNTNNHLGGRATVAQATGYNLIVYDAGSTGPGGTIMPDGSDLDAERIDQATWFRVWLAEGASSEAGSAALWIIGSSALEEKPTNPLYAVDMGATLNASTQFELHSIPDVTGQSAFEFQMPGGTCVADFASDRYQLYGGCVPAPSYDGLGATGAAVVTHRYRHPWNATLGEGAIVMNAGPGGAWNTILQSHPWADIHDPEQQGAPSPQPVQELLAARILNCVLPAACRSGGPSPTDTPQDGPIVSNLPQVTTLHGNAPNPFNATTTIRFDLARDGPVELRIYDVAGRLVRTLVRETLRRDRHAVVWDGRNEDGRRVASGMYFYALRTVGFESSRRMVVIE